MTADIIFRFDSRGAIERGERKEKRVRRFSIRRNTQVDGTRRRLRHIEVFLSLDGRWSQVGLKREGGRSRRPSRTERRPTDE